MTAHAPAVALLMLALLVAGCSKTEESKRPAAAGDSAAATQAPTRTATFLDNIDLNDTEEDPDYAEAGEALAQAKASHVLGTAAPLAVMKTLDGDTLDLGRIYGEKPVYIKFWATWCTPCRQQMPAFQKFYEAHKDEIQVVAINIGLSDDEASVRKFRQRFGLTMPIVMDDGQLARLFHLNVTPQHVLIDRNMRFAHLGHAHNADLERAIQQVLAAPRSADAATAEAVATETVLQTGDRVPALDVTALGGDSLSLRAKPGRVLAISFFSSWCEWYLETTRPSTSQACARVREFIQAANTGPDGIDWLGIAGGPWSTEQDLVDYQAQHQIRMPLALDTSGALFRTFGVRDIPSIVLIDDAGRLLRSLPPDTPDLAAALREAMTPRPPATP